MDEMGKQAEAFFEALDADGDGRISLNEIKKGWGFITKSRESFHSGSFDGPLPVAPREGKAAVETDPMQEAAEEGREVEEWLEEVDVE